MVLALLQGCSINDAYVAGDRATFDAGAGEYVAYVSSDVTLTDEQKKRRGETVASWEARLQRVDPVDPQGRLFPDEGF